MLAQPTILVVGNATTPASLDDLTAFAFDVADRLQFPARVAVGMDYVVTEYEAVVLADDWLDAVPSVVLGVEAQSADVPCLTADEVYAYPINDACGWCGETGNAVPALVGDTWTPSVHVACVPTLRRASTRPLAVAA
ncbi:hypothetical protein [Streptomyces sp. NPDC056105]|uniref:hypothetical protein n=1 Tax=Streptomyces sp. NPDC056105 TaxID=3345714 RepID=UPI0035E1C137